MKRKGSITIFLALLLTCFFSAVFAFLEAARVGGLKANAEYSAAQAEDTVMASYHRELWEQYHLMFWEIPEGDQPGLASLKSLQQAAIEGNQRDTVISTSNYYVLQVHLANVNYSSYQLATDDDGLAFRLQAAEMMKATVGEDALQAVLDWLDTSDEQDDGQTDLETKALDVLEDLEEAKETNKAENESAQNEESIGDSLGNGAQYGDGGNGTAKTESTSSRQVSVEVTENPLEWVKTIQKKGIYAYLMPNEDMSEKSIDLSTCIGKRSMEGGSLETQASVSVTDKVLFHLYLQKYFLDASEDAKDGVLDYEMEYMIVGKANDEANLKGVVRRLLLMREAANLVFLETNASKQEEAALVATALAAAVGQPELEPLVQQGVLAAWAYAESLCDMKILLNGGKVALVKTAEQWQTDISHLSTSFAQADNDSQENGLTYANYLQILLWTTSERKLAERGMDLIEKNLDVEMDQMLACAECAYTFEAESLFWDFVTLGSHSVGTYSFQESGNICFY